MSTLLVETGGAGTELALIQGGSLLAYASAQSAGGVCAGQIYHATVERVLTGIDAVFVRLTRRDAGFLQLKKGETLRSGQTFLAQVKRPPMGDKCAAVTRDVTLAGTYVILLPLGGQVGVSARVTDESARKRLRALGEALRPQGMGLVMRALSADADEQSVSDEVLALAKKFSDMTRALPQAPALVSSAPDDVQNVCRDFIARTPEAIVSNTEALPFPAPACPLRMHEHPMALYAVREQLDKARRRKVWLKSGGFLVLDRCEACLVIDVNTGKNTRGGAREQTVTAQNREAAAEIARLVRLRGEGGVIFIDFIDMDNDQDRALVLDTLKAALADDPVKTTVHGYTALGFVEMTRRRAQQAMPAQRGAPCPHCGGTGVMTEDETDA